MGRNRKFVKQAVTDKPASTDGATTEVMNGGAAMDITNVILDLTKLRLSDPENDAQTITKNDIEMQSQNKLRMQKKKLIATIRLLKKNLRRVKKQMNKNNKFKYNFLPNIKKSSDRITGGHSMRRPRTIKEKWSELRRTKSMD